MGTSKTPKALRGSKREHKKLPGVAAELPPDAPLPPDYLSEDAKIEWLFVLKCFKDLDMFSKIDAGLLECYSRYMALWREAMRSVEITGLTIDNNGKTVVNPKLTAANSIMMHLHKHMAAMGLTPSARSAIRVANPKDEIPEDFKEFLK